MSYEYEIINTSSFFFSCFYCVTYCPVVNAFVTSDNNKYTRIMQKKSVYWALPTFTLAYRQVPTHGAGQRVKTSLLAGVDEKNRRKEKRILYYYYTRCRRHRHRHRLPVTGLVLVLVLCGISPYTIGAVRKTVHEDNNGQDVAIIYRRRRRRSLLTDTEGYYRYSSDDADEKKLKNFIKYFFLFFHSPPPPPPITYPSVRSHVRADARMCMRMP